MSKEKNFSAFPCAAFGPTENDFIHQRGMGLRDWFAGMAMQGLLAADRANFFAKEAYEVADAMMEEGKK